MVDTSFYKLLSELIFLAGLGYQATKALLQRHATVIMACRDTTRATDAAMNIRKTVTEGNFVSRVIRRKI